MVHFLIRRCANDDLPIKSKQPMIFHVGCHRFKARPIYSQHSPGDRHKVGGVKYNSILFNHSYSADHVLIFCHSVPQIMIIIRFIITYRSYELSNSLAPPSHLPNHAHQFERFFLPSSIMVASVYAPLIFPPANVLMFRPDSTSGQPSVSLCRYLPTFVFVFVPLRVCICTSTCLYLFLCVFVFVPLCVCVCTSVCLCLPFCV